MNWYLYIVQCSDKAKSLYTGITNDLDKRIDQHNGLSKISGAKYTKPRRPVKLVYSEKLNSKSEALKREIIIKKFSRVQKEILIKNGII
jgi:putative endonuclease